MCSMGVPKVFDEIKKKDFYSGETYECIREDKGFRYIAEQVSHHPPVTACHAIGKNWTWSQDFRVKTKFWGKV